MHDHSSAVPSIDGSTVLAALAAIREGEPGPFVELGGSLQGDPATTRELPS
jgi:hypothetical protein